MQRGRRCPARAYAGGVVSIVKQSRRRTLLLVLGPVVGVVIGAVSNLLTNHWNWWLFGILAIIVGLAAVVAVALDPGTKQEEYRRHAGRNNRRQDPRISMLPRDIVNFTGRQHEVSRLLSMTSARDQGRNPHGIYIIEGMGGVGKEDYAEHRQFVNSHAIR